MANQAQFTATETWQPISANGSNITNGVFIVYSTNHKPVELLQSDTAPNESRESLVTTGGEAGSGGFRYELGASENLYCRSRREPVIIEILIPG